MRDLTQYQTDYEALPFEDTQLAYRRRKVEETVAHFKPKSILEVGCGMDAYFNACGSYEHYTVIEPGALFYEKAVRDAQNHKNVEVIQGTVQDAASELKGRHYDLIIMASLLHEIEDSIGLLNAVNTLCSPDTVVHISVPNANSFHRLLAVEMGLIDNALEKSETQKAMQQSHTFDLNSLSALVKKAGFKVISSGSFFIKPFTHAQMAYLQEKNVLSPQMLDGLYGMSKHLPENGSEIFTNIQLERAS